MTKPHHLLSSLLLLGVGLLAACGAPPDEPTVDDAPTTDDALVAASTSHGLHGLSGRLLPNTNALTDALYRSESKRWIRWALAQPFSTGAITDTTGAACGLDQSGPLWFLAGTPGGPAVRTCTIPRGKFLLVPLVNAWLTPPNAFVDTPEELAAGDAFAEEYLLWQDAHTCGLELRIDGVPVASPATLLQLGTLVLTPFSVTLDDDNFQPGNPGGPRIATWTAGHYALLTPLAPGRHTLELAGARCEDDGVTRWFETSVRYELTVR